MSVAAEITIRVRRDIIRATATGGAVGFSVPNFDPLRLATIKAFEELLLEDLMDYADNPQITNSTTLEKKRIGKPSHLKVLGRQLYAALFSKSKEGETSIPQLLKDQLVIVKGERVRLQLLFDKDLPPDAQWINLPWEFLYSEDRPGFLSTDFNLVLSRYFELGTPREKFDPGQEALRLLVVISRPANEAAVMAKEVYKKIKEMETGHSGTLGVPKANLEVKDLKQPDRQKLEDMLRAFKPHVLHFIGHGKYDPASKTGSLLLVIEDTNEANPITTDQLLETFITAQCFPRLVFLHMCEGGISERDSTTLQAFSGFAPRLIHAKIPTVVAMQYPIKNSPARDFSLAFYEVLASGGSVDEAVQEGRRKIDDERRSLVFGTPVLFMHSAAGLVLPPLKPGEGTKIAGGAAVENDDIPADATSPPFPGKLPPVEPSHVKQIIEIGRKTVDQTLTGGARAMMYVRLSKLESQLTGKSNTDVLNQLVELYDNEEDDQIKDNIWWKMISVLDVTS